MIIVRDGTKIKLTDDELTKAYFEQEHLWDMEEIRYRLAEDESDKVEDNDYVSRVAYRYRKYIDDYPGGDTEWECYNDACRYINKVDEMTI